MFWILNFKKKKAENHCWIYNKNMERTRNKSELAIDYRTMDKISMNLDA